MEVYQKDNLMIEGKCRNRATFEMILTKKDYSERYSIEIFLIIDPSRISNAGRHRAREWHSYCSFFQTTWYINKLVSAELHLTNAGPTFATNLDTSPRRIANYPLSLARTITPAIASSEVQ